MNFKLKGDPNALTGAFKLKHHVNIDQYPNWGMYPYEGSISLNVNCDSQEEHQITISAGAVENKPEGPDMSLVNSWLGPYFFTLMFYDKSSDKWVGYLDNCKFKIPDNPSDPPKNVKLAVGDFDETNCSNVHTITWNKIAGYTYEVTLYNDKEMLAKAKAGTQQVFSEGVDITGSIQTDDTYLWVSNWDEAQKGETYRFQVAVRGKKDAKSKISSYVWSDVVVKDDISCAGYNVEIKSIKKVSNIAIQSGESVMPKIHGPFTIEVESKRGETGYPESIVIEVSCDADNTDSDRRRVQFYSDSNSVSTTIKTITLQPKEKSINNRYTALWDGRDGIANRILLGGKYKIKATARFRFKEGAGYAEVDHSVGFLVEKPKLTSVTCKYPSWPQSEIAGWVENYKTGLVDPEAEGAFVFNSDDVQYLIEKVDPDKDTIEDYFYKFDWLVDFGVIGKQIPVNDFYDPPRKESSTSVSQTDMRNIKEDFAVYSWLGHAGIRSEAPKIPELMFDQNYLYAGCGEFSKSGSVCLDKDGDGNKRDVKCDTANTDPNAPKKLWMDDVLLAVLMGCRTNVDGDGGPSMAKQMIAHGVDCVIATERRVLLPVMVFWYYHFYDLAFVTLQSIANATENAYLNALQDLIYLYPMCKTDGEWWDPTDEDDMADLIEVWSGEVDYYTSTIKILDNDDNISNGDPIEVSTTRILPPRYGSMKPCPAEE